MLSEKSTSLDFSKHVINATPIGNVLSKRELKTMYKELMGQTNGLTTVFTYMSKLIIAGYLQATETPGFYRVLKHVEDDLTYNALTESYKDNSAVVKELNAPGKQQVGGDHYLKMKYQPVDLCCELDLSFIQGSIIKYVTRHKFKNGKQDIAKAKHFAQLAISNGHTFYPRESWPKEAYKFCLENNMESTESNIVKAAISNRYQIVIDLCDDLLLTYNQGD